MNVLSPTYNLRAILALFSLLFKQRELTIEMTKREFSERYKGQMLGVLWGFAHPIIVIGVYVVIFSFVFQARTDQIEGANSDSYTIYLLAGLVPWMAMAEALGKSTQVITGNANLVKQVIFPLEVLPTKLVIATFVNEAILLVGVLIYTAFQYGGVPWTVALLPVLLALQFMQMLGLAMLLSTIGAYVRDSKDLVQVFCLVNVYLMPILYRPEWLPSSLGWLVYLNPFTYQTLCFQDAICHGTLTHYWAWPCYLLLSVLSLGLGYRLFNKVRTHFGNVL